MKHHPKALWRHGCAAALVTACVSVTTPVAADELTFPAGEACPGFPLKVEFSPDAGHLLNRVFVDKNGNFVRFLQAGQNFPITFTNLSSGSSYRVKPEGTVFSVTPNADGSETWVMTGHGHHLGRVRSARRRAGHDPLRWSPGRPGEQRQRCLSAAVQGQADRHLRRFVVTEAEVRALGQTWIGPGTRTAAEDSRPWRRLCVRRHGPTPPQ